jgi:hypothetical protein
MKLTPVREYEGARYPSLAEHMARKNGRLGIQPLALAAALAALAALMSGCWGPS